MVLPSHAVLTVFEPFLAAPTIAVKLDDLLHEIPSPDEFAVWLDGKNLCPQRDKINAVSPGCWRGKNWLASVDLADECATVAVEHIVIAGGGADMYILSDHRGRSDIVAVARPTFG